MNTPRRSRRRGDIARAKKLYERFRERTPRRFSSVNVDLPGAVAIIGRVSAIEYETTHGKKSVPYRHEFAIGSRPLLGGGSREGQLYLLKGRFRITSRGIVDLDSQRRELP